MAQLSEILAKEQNRMDATARSVVHLYREGSFLRAYEWSAWLYIKYYNELKVNARHVKSLGATMAFVGFPQTSIDKFTPQGAKVVPEADGSVSVVLPFDIAPDKVQDMVTEFDAWKATIPVEVPQPKADNRPQRPDERRNVPYDIPQHASQRPHAGVFSILQTIMSYPVENSTPSDNLQFITSLKHQVAGLL